MLLLAAATGCGTAKETSRPAASKEPPGIAAHVIRGKELQEAQNDLRQLALFYRTYETEAGRPPETLTEVTEYVRKDMPTLAKRLDEGHYVMELGTKRTPETRVLAYEKEPDLNGAQLVAMTDGTVNRMSPTELKAALGKR